MGSIRAARRAGKTLATKAQEARSAEGARKVTGSSGPTPTSRLPSAEASAAAATRPLVASMLAVLRTGTPAQWSAEPEEGSRRMANQALAERFTTEMECRAVWLGPRLARRVDLQGRRHLLDIGGAAGAYACAFPVS